MHFIRAETVIVFKNKKIHLNFHLVLVDLSYGTDISKLLYKRREPGRDVLQVDVIQQLALHKAGK